MTTEAVWNQPVRSDVRADEWPYEAFPTGWFHIAWSGELAPGDLRPMRYFEQDLVLYRTRTGELRVVDAHCPHRGAHLGYGGRVEGDRIVCPNHGWQWDGCGRNAGIPGTDRTAGGRRLRTWHVREVGEMVYLWHDALDREPYWEPLTIPQDGDPAFHRAYPQATGIAQVPFQPNILMENMADMVHVKYVHKWVDIPSLDLWSEDGPYLRTVFSGDIPTPKGPKHLVLTNASWGVGIVYAYFDGLREAVEIIGCTPVDRHTSDFRLTLWIRRGPDSMGDEPDGLAQAIFRGQYREVIDPEAGSGSDRPIWDNMRYVARPPFAKEEARVLSGYRKWVKQFYPF